MSETINERYNLQSEIGSGGMGVVYRAYDRLTGETVALKRVHINKELELTDSISPHDTQEQLRLVLAKEFQILAGLRHPNIISVLDYGFDGEERPFYTMTFLESSQTILEAGAVLDQNGKLDLIEQLLQGLAYLHRRGILHRDIKPENVLVVDGVLRLLDFGLSQKTEEEGVEGGSPRYMAPELFNGDDPSEATDLYAVGVLLYQLLTSQHPFGPFNSGFYRRLLAQTPDWGSIDPQFHPILKTLLAKDPKHRPQSAQTVLKSIAASQGRSLPAETIAIRESYLQAARFVGREPEMTQLTTALETAKKGEGSAWLIGGESGVGKSRLINELQTRALVQGFQILRGQAAQNDAGMPFQLWREPIRHLIATLPKIDELSTGVLHPLVPDIEHLLDRSVKPAPELKDDAAQTRLFSTIARLFWQAKRPLLLVLEDLQEASSSLVPLPFLTRQISEHPLLIVATFRSDERPDLPNRLADMTLLNLSRLSPEAITELSESMLGDTGRKKEIQTLLQRETEGNAFFAVEVVRTLAEEAGRLGDIGQMELPANLLPRGIQDIIQRRVRKLPEAVKAFLVKAAVAGRELELPLIREIHSRDEHDLENRWLPLSADAAILDVQNGGWQFSHGKIRDGLLAELSSADKANIHAEIAEAIEKLYPADDLQAARLAFHWEAANHPDKELPYRLTASQQALSQFSHQDALSHLARAYEITPENSKKERFDIVGEYVRALQHIGQKDEVANWIQTLSALAEEIGEPEKIIVASARQIDFQNTTGEFGAAIELAEKIVKRFEGSGDAIFSELFPNWAMSYLLSGKIEESRAILDRAIPYLEGTNSRKEVHIYVIRGIVEYRLGDFDASKQNQEKAVALGEELGYETLIISALNNLAILHIDRGELEPGTDYIEQALAFNKRVGNQLLHITLLVNLGVLKMMKYRYDQFEEHTVEALSLAEELGNQQNIAITTENLGHFNFKFGRYKEGLAYANQSLNILEKVAKHDAYLLGNVWQVIGDNLFQMGRLDEALNAYQSALAFRKERGEKGSIAHTQASLVVTCLTKGNEDEAVTLAEPILTVLEQNEGADFDQLYLHYACYKLFYKKDRSRAFQFLKSAYNLLMSEAKRISEVKDRRIFLEEIVLHREIIQLFNACQDVV